MDSERWLLKVSSASDSKRPKHQQDSSPCQAKNTQTECFTSPLEPIKNKASVPKHPNASSSRASVPSKKPFETWIPNDGCSKSRQRQIRKDRNTSKIRAHAKQKNTQTECFTSPLEPIKNKASVPKHPNASSSRASAKQKNRSKRGFRTMAAQSLVSVRFEKTETPASFEPMPSKKHADRMLHVTFGTHKKQSVGAETPERQQQSSLCQAKNRSKRGFRTMAAQSLVSVRFEKTETPARFEPMPSKKHADRMLHVTFGTHKKQSFERQQQSKSRQRQIRKQKTVRNVDSERWLLKVSSASDSKRPKHQQDSSPCQAKKHADRMLHVTFGTHKKQSFGAERPERQQQSSLCQAKNRSKRGFRTMAAQSLVSVRFEKTETPARFEPMPSKKTRRQNASRHLWNP